jgi:glycosyltransferase involved in cell wall biosynthesis
MVPKASWKEGKLMTANTNYSVIKSFSVIIPLFNKKDFVLRTVQSALSQSTRADEVIVVDDGSTDGGADALSIIADDRLKIIKQKNVGVSCARNQGIKNAIGNWIAFLDADDIWHQDHLSELARVIDKYPSSGLVSTHKKEVDAHLVTGASHYFSDNPGAIQTIDYLATAYDRFDRVHTSCVAVKKSALDEIGGFIETITYGEDIELWTRLALHYPVSASTRVTSIYVRNTGGLMDSLSSTVDPPQLPCRIDSLSPALSTIFRYLEEHPHPPMPPKIRDHINGRIKQDIKSALYRRDVRRAKALASLAVPMGNKKHHSFFLIKWIPAPLLSLSIYMYKRIKTLIRAGLT